MPQLHLFYLGGSAGQSNIEVHDVQFAVCDTWQEAIPALKAAWFGDADKIHIDGWQVINWAVGPEGISLAEGREIFGGRTVLGGFENGKNGLLYTGDKAAIQAETKRIIAETGTTGLVIGADCTIPSDIDEERIEWVREAAAE